MDAEAVLQWQAHAPGVIFGQEPTAGAAWGPGCQLGGASQPFHLHQANSKYQLAEAW